MGITYLWVDEIFQKGLIGQTNDMVKIAYNRSKLDDDLQKSISIQLLPINKEPVLEGVIFLGRFFCHIRIDKDETVGKMILIDIRLKNETEWEAFFKETCSDQLSEQLLVAYWRARFDLGEEKDFFELSIHRLE